MKILVRLPNWLGDMVMSAGFMHQLSKVYPGAAISVIVKKGIHELLPFFPPAAHVFVFDKQQYRGWKGLKKFGKSIRNTERFDLFFSLPNSFSSAAIGYFSGAGKRVGYKKELRQLLLTDAFVRPEKKHRAEEYVQLLEMYSGKKLEAPQVLLKHAFHKGEHLVVNINSEASSRRLTVEKAVELIAQLRAKTSNKIFLIGALKEKEFVNGVLALLPDQNNMESLAGKTQLPELVGLLASARLLLTTDSGPAHLANALGTHTVVLFGAGDETHTAPYNPQWRSIIRLGQLSCEPCEKNICVRYGIPQCLERLNSQAIVQEAKLHL